MNCKYCQGIMKFQEYEADGDTYYEYYSCENCMGLLTIEGKIVETGRRWSYDYVVDDE